MSVIMGRTPTHVHYSAEPFADAGRQRTLGLFTDDLWSINRVTLNLGLRFDYLNGRVPALDLDAGPFVPARSFPEVTNVPNWKDVNPRVGAAYDLFGTGNKAVKGFFGRYGIFEPMAGISS